jgi:transcriptional regulator with GAF, ATPase, and Fis domain
MHRLEGSLAGVLIEGESGTGKELVARALHQRSRLAEGPLVCINCGALDRSLVRSELFGHKKGAFTGAIADSVGALEAADGGTLFLDEVGELPLDVQPVLLRALESGEFCRVGETRARRVTVRIIAATNRDLERDVEDGLFREDLFFRLRVVSLHVPPLSARGGDIPLIVRTLASRLGLPDLPDDVTAELSKRSYRGNVRELKHAVEAYGALGELPDGSRPKAGSLAKALEALLDESRPYAEQKEFVVEEMTRIYLRKLIDKTSGNRSEAARIAELQRGYLRRLLEKYDLT